MPGHKHKQHTVFDEISDYSFVEVYTRGVGRGGGSEGSDDPPPLFGGKFYTFPI